LPYCPACVAFFTVLETLSAERENQAAEKPEKKTGPTGWRRRCGVMSKEKAEA